LIDEEKELLEHFRKLNPNNRQLVLANIRLVSITETTVKMAVLEELGMAGHQIAAPASGNGADT
jgi:hypothetical protein